MTKVYPATFQYSSIVYALTTRCGVCEMKATESNEAPLTPRYYDAIWDTRGNQNSYFTTDSKRIRADV